MTFGDVTRRKFVHHAARTVAAVTLAPNFLGRAEARLSRGSTAPPAWAYTGATIDLDAANGRYYGGSLASLFPVARIGSNATDLLPTSASGASYNTFGPNTPRITPGLGVLCEESRINYLLNSTVPVTQTTQSLATGTYTIWVNGSGSATPSAGTATLSGQAAATNGSPNTFTVTVAGTVVVTVSGSLNAFQLELSGSAGYSGSSLIITGATIGVRAADQFAFANAAFNIVSSAAFTMIFGGCKRLGVNDGFLIGGNDTGSVSLEDHDASPALSQSLNSVTYLARSSAMLPQGTAANVGMTLNPSLNAVKVTGGTMVTDATATPQTPGTFYQMGNRGSSNYHNGYIGRLTMFSTPLTSAVLNGLI